MKPWKKDHDNVAIGYDALSVPYKYKSNIAVGPKLEIVKCHVCDISYVSGYHPENDCPMTMVEGVMCE